MSNKMSCDFTGFKDLLERLDEISGDIKPAVNECLEKVHGMITEEAAERSKSIILPVIPRNHLLISHLWNGVVCKRR